jgi:mono/diheme cytochrome c family protein
MTPIKRTAAYLGIAFTFLMALSWASGSAIAQEELEQERLNQGGRIYAENCAVCHGEAGEGRVGATLAKDWPSIRPDLTVRNIVINGIPGTTMPAWSQVNGGPLTNDEIEALIYYILSWQTGGPPPIDLPTSTPRPVVPPPPNLEAAGDATRGAMLYDENCALCHGPEGEGRIGATLARDWPSFRPALTVRSVVANGIPGSLMPAWSQANGGPLTEGEIDDITAFVLTWQGVGAAPLEPTQTPGEITLGLSWLIWVIVLVLLLMIGIALNRRPAS